MNQSSTTFSTSRLNVAFVLTSSPSDIYADMATVATAMVRRVHPDACIWMLVDEKTAVNLPDRAGLLMEAVDEYRVVQTGYEAPAMRAGCLKSKLRQQVQGDFIFLDVDAIPIRPFGEVVNQCEDIGAVLDRHDLPDDYRYPQWEQDVMAKLGWTLPKPYFNSGVLVFRDTPAAHELGAEWQRRWQQVQALGRWEDQPSFNSAIEVLKPRVKILPGGYNAQIHMKPHQVRNASIIHFFSVSVGSNSMTVLGKAVHTLKQTGKLDMQLLDRMLETGFPWTDENWVSAQLAMGRPVRAARAAVCKAFHKLLGR